MAQFSVSRGWLKREMEVVLMNFVDQSYAWHTFHGTVQCVKRFNYDSDQNRVHFKGPFLWTLFWSLLWLTTLACWTVPWNVYQSYPKSHWPVPVEKDLERPAVSIILGLMLIGKQHGENWKNNLQSHCTFWACSDVLELQEQIWWCCCTQASVYLIWSLWAVLSLCQCVSESVTVRIIDLHFRVQLCQCVL